MYKRYTLLCLSSLLLLLGGCTKEVETKSETQGCDDDTPTCAVADAADMSAYEGFLEEENQFIQIPMKDAILKLESESSGIFYIGYPTCKWCIEAVPVMNEVAKANNQQIYYIDKKAETSDEASILKMEELLSDILTTNDEGKKTLFVPEVIVVKDGEIIANHMGTVEDHDAKERKMNAEEVAQLKLTYEEMFQKLK